MDQAGINTSKLSRRSFLAGLVCAPAIVKIESLMPISVLPNIVGETEFGFTYGSLNFSELIVETLRNNANLVADNISKNNPLLLKLKNRNYFKINYIDPAVQTQRMIEKIQQKRLQKCVNPNNLLVAVQQTNKEILIERQLEIENRDKWDNKFVWYNGYDNVGNLIHKETKNGLR